MSEVLSSNTRVHSYYFQTMFRFSNFDPRRKPFFFIMTLEAGSLPAWFGTNPTWPDLVLGLHCQKKLLFDISFCQPKLIFLFIKKKIYIIVKSIKGQREIRNIFKCQLFFVIFKLFPWQAAERQNYSFIFNYCWTSRGKNTFMGPPEPEKYSTSQMYRVAHECITVQGPLFSYLCRNKQ